MTAAAAPVPARARSYRAILASSALIGGASALNVLIGIVRTKLMALVLGPAGFGLMGAYLVICDLARAVAQVGLNSSGVRRIAAAQSSGDDARIGLTVAVLRRTSVACGVAGGLGLVLLSGPIASLTFGDEAHAGGVAVLGAAVMLSVVAAGQGALLQGLRRVRELAWLTLVGGVVGTVVGVPLVWRFGVDGVAPTVVAIAGAGCAASWWFARRVRHPAPPRAAGQGAQAREAWALLRLGAVFMGSGLLTAAAAWGVRIIVLRHDGLAAAGVYQAAWTLGGVYTGFILQSLGTDFYPRLVGAMRDPAEGNRLVNEQTQVGLLIALPGVLATITLAPLAIQLLYSAGFDAAVGTLRWICLGMALRVLSWPLGFIVIAQDRQRLYLAIEAAWSVVNLALTWACVQRFGVDGAGMAFCGSYVFHVAVLLPVARHCSGFAWSRDNRRLAAAGVAATAAVFAGFQWLPGSMALAFGLAATAAAVVASARRLLSLAEPQRLPRWVGWLLRLGHAGFAGRA